jgi:SAM-dependent methyltransferase
MVRESGPLRPCRRTALQVQGVARSPAMTGSRSFKRSKHSAGLPAADRAMWTRLYAGLESRSIPWMNQGPFPPLVQAVQDGWLGPPNTILDVGCGVGTNSFWLATQGFRATGIDVAPGAIASAESSRAPGANNPTFAVDDLLATNLAPARFHAAVDVGCFQTLPPRTRRDFSDSLARLLSPGAPYVVFWVAREERGSWGPPHRLSVGDVVESFETSFLVDRVAYRPRSVRLTAKVRRSARPLLTLAGYTARLLRRSEPQPRAR